jgi:sulfur relay (sulfurtransferase) complex TusBCD TusD component (DsrE family)
MSEPDTSGTFRRGVTDPHDAEVTKTAGKPAIHPSVNAGTVIALATVQASAARFIHLLFD